MLPLVWEERVHPCAGVAEQAQPVGEQLRVPLQVVDDGVV